MKDISAATMTKVLKAVSGGRDPLPEAEIVVAAFIKKAGGPEHLGNLLWQEYQQAGKGSVAAQRILSSVLHIMSESAGRKRLSDQPLSDLTDAELEALLADTMKTAGVTDAVSSPGPAATAGQATPEGEAPAVPTAAAP